MPAPDVRRALRLPVTPGFDLSLVALSAAQARCRCLLLLPELCRRSKSRREPSPEATLPIARSTSVLVATNTLVVAGYSSF